VALMTDIVCKKLPVLPPPEPEYVFPVDFGLMTSVSPKLTTPSAALMLIGATINDGTHPPPSVSDFGPSVTSSLTLFYVGRSLLVKVIDLAHKNRRMHSIFVVPGEKGVAVCQLS
jgi:hypothetical protein